MLALDCVCGRVLIIAAAAASIDSRLIYLTGHSAGGGNPAGLGICRRTLMADTFAEYSSDGHHEVYYAFLYISSACIKFQSTRIW